MNILTWIIIGYLFLGAFETGRWYEDTDHQDRKRIGWVTLAIILGTIVYPAAAIADVVWSRLKSFWSNVNRNFQFEFWLQYLFWRSKLKKTFAEMQKIQNTWEPTLRNSKSRQHRAMKKCLHHLCMINDYDPSFKAWAQLNVYQYTYPANETIVFRIKDVGSVGYVNEEEVYKKHYKNLPQYKQWKTGISGNLYKDYWEGSIG